MCLTKSGNMIPISTSEVVSSNVLSALGSNSPNIREVTSPRAFLLCAMLKVAILVDGAFYKKRVNKLNGPESPQEAANTLYKYCQKHLKAKEETMLYRIFYYDCPPSSKKVYQPLTQKQINLAKEPLYQWNTDFLDELKSKRKLALRLGVLAEEQAVYNLRPEITKQLLAGKISVTDITEKDLSLTIKQKGVDMRIGIDIVAMAIKKQVDRIVLIAGDSDFVPAAKLARREGIDFILDPMWAPIKPQLHEHIDGLKSFSFKSNKIFE